MEKPHFFFSFQVSFSCRWHLSWSESLCPFTRHSAETFPGLTMFRHCTCCLNLCECVCPEVLLHLKDTISFGIICHLFVFYSLFFHVLSGVDSSLQRGGFHEDIPFITVFQGLSLSVHCPFVDLCFNSHPLQNEASLMMTE